MPVRGVLVISAVVELNLKPALVHEIQELRRDRKTGSGAYHSVDAAAGTIRSQIVLIPYPVDDLRWGIDRTTVETPAYLARFNLKAILHAMLVGTH